MVLLLWAVLLSFWSLLVLVLVPVLLVALPKTSCRLNDPCRRRHERTVSFAFGRFGGQAHRKRVVKDHHCVHEMIALRWPRSSIDYDVEEPGSSRGSLCCLLLLRAFGNNNHNQCSVLALVVFLELILLARESGARRAAGRTWSSG